MRNKMTKILTLMLAVVMTLSLNLTAFAQENNVVSENTYTVTIGDTTVEVPEGSYVEVPEGSYVEVPMQSLLQPTRAASDTVVGDAGSLTVWGSGHYVYWTVVMTVPATSFLGTVSTTDITSGFSAGSPAIAGFAGSVYTASISGHQYTAVLDGIAYNGTTPVARTLSNRITWLS